MNRKIQITTNIIDDHFGRDIKVSDLAKMAIMSELHYYRQFKKNRFDTI